MTPRERLKTVLSGRLPDCVPVAPDFSNMIPARHTGKPFWDLSLYKNPPVWKAYIDCARRFDIDSVMDGYWGLEFDEEKPAGPPWEQFIVKRTPDRIVTQASRVEGGRREWAPRMTVYHRDQPRVGNIRPEDVGLPETPKTWEPVEGVQPDDHSPAGLAAAKAYLGDQGLFGVFVTTSCALSSQEDIFRYFDNPDKHERWAQERVEAAERRFAKIMALDVKPDFLCVGGSGTLIFQTPEIFRQLAFPAVRRVIELATAAGMPTHIHSCGPETELVKIMAEETNLTVIDPLEVPPMGDCNLADLKRLYGRKLTLKGNLHTTDVMLKGSVADVVAASKKAIDDAAEGGRFILSTGDQCGRDTPDENLHAMVEAARTYGRY
jgi:uroporphyrinogen decarboxylase